jgi:t-SNARE complex subunit (syntaxin)
MSDHNEDVSQPQHEQLAPEAEATADATGKLSAGDTRRPRKRPLGICVVVTLIAVAVMVTVLTA